MAGFSESWLTEDFPGRTSLDARRRRRDRQRRLGVRSLGRRPDGHGRGRSPASGTAGRDGSRAAQGRHDGFATAHLAPDAKEEKERRDEKGQHDRGDEHDRSARPCRRAPLRLRRFGRRGRSDGPPPRRFPDMTLVTDHAHPAWPSLSIWHPWPAGVKTACMTLLSTGAPPLHWALAGAGIGIITLVLLFTTSHRLGISGGFEDICSLVLRVPYLRRAEVLSTRPWRLPFLCGLVAAGALSVSLARGWSPSWDLGRFDVTFGWGPAGKVGLMFVGGLLIGFGTRLAGGCTSGHGIFGLSNLERASLHATIAFMASGVATSALVYRILAP
jgi:uncharacterized membrane protein YedE/YeeE